MSNMELIKQKFEEYIEDNVGLDISTDWGSPLDNNYVNDETFLAFEIWRNAWKECDQNK